MIGSQIPVHALYLVRRRAGYVQDVADSLYQLYASLVSGSTELRMTYQSAILPNMMEKDYLAMMDEYREREMDSGFVLFGPHKDDLLFHSEGAFFKDRASLGQMRMAGIVLKLVQTRYMMGTSDQVPILLLDDVFFELDPRHREVMRHHLESEYKGVQMFECVNDRKWIDGKDLAVIELG